MKYGGKYFNYLLVCPRKLWLYAGGLGMEHTSERVAEGTLLHETAYPSRSARYEELEVGPVKIDFYDPRERVIHEVKLSDRMEEAHLWQVKYYQLVLERIGVEGVTAILEYPSIRHTEQLGVLTDVDREHWWRWSGRSTALCRPRFVLRSRKNKRGFAEDAVISIFAT